MAKQLITQESTNLTRKQRRQLQRQYVQAVKPETTVSSNDGGNFLPIKTGYALPTGFWTPALNRPFHRATGFKLASANLFSAADVHDPAGPVIGVELVSGGRAFSFDPHEMYLRGLVSSPNLLIQGSLRQGKSFFIKRLVTLLTQFGRYAINTSDSKGEHGIVAEAIGGTVFKMGVFNSPIRINALDAPDRRLDETEQDWEARVKAARVSVLAQLATLLNPGERPVTARESTILDWALSVVVSETNDQPTIRAVWEKICSPDLLKAHDSYFQPGDANDLRDGLRRLVHGDLGGMFDMESSVRLDPQSPYTVIDTFAINQRGSQALAVTQAVTNAWVQSTISNKSAGRRYFLIREEGWRDMKSVAALEAHQEQLKLSGEYGVAMVMIVHEDGDFDSVGAEGSKERELAKSLLRGYANRICFNQPAPTLLNAVASRTFTEAEAGAISTLSRGQFLVKMRNRSYVVDGNPTTTDWERHLFDTDAQMRERAAEFASVS